MPAAPTPHDEADRLAALRALAILDSTAEQAYDDLTYLASRILRTPIALVSLVDEDRQWFKSVVGLGVTETHRDLAFCAHAILEPNEVLVVEDAALDPRFATNALVTGDPSIRFYAGTPLVDSTGHALGTLCVIDREPRQLDDGDREALSALGRQVVAQLELRRKVFELDAAVLARDHKARGLEVAQRDLELALQDLAKLAATDPLTGLANRRTLEESMDRELAAHRRYGAPASLAIIDIDHFKHVNDTHGHDVGDQALIAVADAILRTTRDTDLCARFGGEEFVVMMPSTDLTAAYLAGERIRRDVEALGLACGPLTVSVGVACAGAALDEPGELLRAADQALYEAKRSGRNRVCVTSAVSELAP